MGLLVTHATKPVGVSYVAKFTSLMSDNQTNISGGYVLLPRDFYNEKAQRLSPIARDIFFYLMQKVNYKDGKTHKKGECFISYDTIRNDLSWRVGGRKSYLTKSQIQSAIRSMKNNGLLTTKKSSRGLHLVIVNYSFTQNPSSYISDN